MDRKVSAIIVDDEKGARDTLRRMLELYCQDVTLLGEADSIDIALTMIWKTNPDIIFLDIEMPQGSGFDLVDKLNGVDSKVIFTTAYSKYALRAIKASAFDYLLKPIDILELKESIAKSKSRIIENLPATAENELEKNTETNELKEPVAKLAIPSSDGYDIVNTEDIIFCEGEKNYTTFNLKDKKPIVASKTLKEYEKHLASSSFVRVHQKYLVNFNYVVRYIKGRGGILVLSNGKNIPISQNRRAQLNEALIKFIK